MTRRLRKYPVWGRGVGEKDKRTICRQSPLQLRSELPTWSGQLGTGGGTPIRPVRGNGQRLTDVKELNVDKRILMAPILSAPRTCYEPPRTRKRRTCKRRSQLVGAEIGGRKPARRVLFLQYDKGSAREGVGAHGCQILRDRQSHGHKAASKFWRALARLFSTPRDLTC
ncbi:MAG: hypothetical protein H6R26_1322 [Proteobacteria bacterium]|nr:hypothetical protein [Pseudomonadota bacterium]